MIIRNLESRVRRIERKLPPERAVVQEIAWLSNSPPKDVGWRKHGDATIPTGWD